MSRVFISIKHLVCSCFHILQDGFLRWTRPLNTSLLLGALADLARGKSELVAENALLRQQLIILRRQSKRPVCSKRDRILLVLLAKAVRAWRQALLIVQPETLLRWHHTASSITDCLHSSKCLAVFLPSSPHNSIRVHVSLTMASHWKNGRTWSAVSLNTTNPCARLPLITACPTKPSDVSFVLLATTEQDNPLSFPPACL
jgi:hypothetical protein